MTYDASSLALICPQTDNRLSQTGPGKSGCTVIKTLAAASCCLSLAAGGSAIAQQLRTDCFHGCFDNWLSFQRNTDDSNQWEYQPRFYTPFSLPRGWTFTQRIDLPVSYTDQAGIDNPTGGWKAGINDWFVEEIFIRRSWPRTSG